jgi:hypothetical protein
MTRLTQVRLALRFAGDAAGFHNTSAPSEERTAGHPILFLSFLSQLLSSGAT